jgi:Mg2+/Co2+ transporter CorB
LTHLQILLLTLCLLFLVLCTAFFSLAETALMTINRYRLRHKARIKKRYAVRLLNLLKRPDRLLNVILFGSTFTIILAATLTTLIAFHFGE